MADREIEIGKENRLFSVSVSTKYERNLQTVLDYCLHYWGAVTMVKLHNQIIKELESLTIFPYANPQNRFLEDVHYREIMLQKFPYVVTYHINRDTVRVINILHTSRNPIQRKALK
jgi:plasmid stabilization system protein ParE